MYLWINAGSYSQHLFLSLPDSDPLFLEHNHLFSKRTYVRDKTVVFTDTVLRVRA